MRKDVSRLLTVRNRSFASRPGKLLLGPTGRRLWMDYMEPAPGFIGRADFIHKLNLPLLFTVRRAGRGPLLEPMESTWRPEQSVFQYQNDELTFWEQKLITWEDQALSLQRWTNRTDEPLTLRLELPEGAALDAAHRFPPCAHGLEPVLYATSNVAWPNGALAIPPRETCTFWLAAAVGLPGEERAMAEGLAALLCEPEGLLERKAREYLRWFDDVPDFECDDSLMERCWYYRFYILRKNLSQPGLGRLPGRTFYEGRAHAMPKTPYAPKGWEFSRLIPLSTPLQATDARWLRDGEIVKDAMRALTGCADEHGAFAVTAVDGSQKEYAQYAAWALYLLYLCHGDADFIREVLPAFKRDVNSVYERMRSPADSLQIERVHALTGKEYQPSYWYFTPQCFPERVRPAQEGYTPLKRVDRSIYMYLNLLGLSRLCDATGDPDGPDFARRADQLRREVLDKMWDSTSECFYDLHYETDAKAYVKNIVAFYPFWAEITDERHLPALKYLLSPDCFATGSGFASAGADCPVFSPCGGWRGQFIKGRNGCMWNGPSWPYTTGIALDALARQSRLHDHRYDADFERFLHEYTLEHFRLSDPEQPYLVEFYNSVTGEPLSDEPDYNHSFYADLIVRHLAGLEPAPEGVRFQPLRTSLSYFSLTGVRLGGHELDVFYQRAPGRRFAEYGAGYTVRVDGEVRFSGVTGLESIPLPLDPTKED